MIILSMPNAVPVGRLSFLIACLITCIRLFNLLSNKFLVIKFLKAYYTIVNRENPESCLGMKQGGKIMFCSKCGTEIPEGASVCPNCGAAASSIEATNKGQKGSGNRRRYRRAADIHRHYRHNRKRRRFRCSGHFRQHRSRR